MRSFIAIQPFNYRTGLVSRPMNLCGGWALPISIDWSDYGASTTNNQIKVVVSMQAAASNKVAADFSIKSIYIDNLGSTIPIYVYFPDTGFTVVAAPYTATWYPVVTSQLVAEVIGLGFVTGSIPTTKLFFANVFVPPYADAEIQNVFPQYLGSPLIQRTQTLTPGFGPPSLGDQAANVSAALGGTTSGSPPAGTRTATLLAVASPTTDFYYLTGFIIYNTQQQTISATAHTSFMDIRLRDETNDATIYKWRSYTSATATAATTNTMTNPPVISIGGINLRLLGSHSYGLIVDQVFLSSGVTTTWGVSINAFCSFTQNPN